MSLKESEDLLKGHATAERTKSDWAFLGNGVVLLICAIGLVVAIAFMIGGWFR